MCPRAIKDDARADEETGAIAIGAPVRVGQTLRFHIRDACRRGPTRSNPDQTQRALRYSSPRCCLGHPTCGWGSRSRTAGSRIEPMRCGRCTPPYASSPPNPLLGALERLDLRDIEWVIAGRGVRAALPACEGGVASGTAKPLRDRRRGVLLQAVGRHRPRTGGRTLDGRM